MKLHDYKPLVNYTKQSKHRQIASLNEQSQHKGLMAWLMGETAPTRLEAILCGAGLVTVFVWFLIGVTG